MKKYDVLWKIDIRKKDHDEIDTVYTTEEYFERFLEQAKEYEATIYKCEKVYNVIECKAAC